MANGREILRRSPQKWIWDLINCFVHPQRLSLYLSWKSRERTNNSRRHRRAWWRTQKKKKNHANMPGVGCHSDLCYIYESDAFTDGLLAASWLCRCASESESCDRERLHPQWRAYGWRLWHWMAFWYWPRQSASKFSSLSRFQDVTKQSTEHERVSDEAWHFVCSLGMF